MKNKTVLVTGSEGFIGKNLIVRLQELDNVVIKSFDKEDNIDTLKKYLKESDIVFHFAGVNRPKNVEEFERVNVDLTTTLVELLEEMNKKIPIVITSSIQVELDNPYGKSKKMAEDKLIKYAKKNSVPVYIYRLPNAFGKWSKPNYNSVVSTFCYNISHNLDITISDPKRELELVYIDGIVDEFVKPKMPSEDWDWEGVSERMQAEIGFPLEWVEDARRDLNRDEFAEKLLATVNDAYAEKEKAVGEKTMRQLERYVLLQMVDTYWKEHLLNMDHLKEGIGLQGYGQKNPLNEYKKEGFNMFMAVMETVKQKTVDTLFRIQLVQDDEVDQMSMEQRRKKQQTKANRRDGEIGRQPVIREGQKIGRNAPCPCGSGKKYKRCCGKK